MGIRIPSPIDPQMIGELAEQAVLKVAELTAPGEEKHRLAVKMVAEKVDELLKFGNGPVGIVLEAIDGAAAELIVGAFVKFAYNQLVERGIIKA